VKLKKSQSYNEKQFTILSGERGFQSVCPSCNDLWIRRTEALKNNKKIQLSEDEYNKV